MNCSIDPRRRLFCRAEITDRGRPWWTVTASNLWVIESLPGRLRFGYEAVISQRSGQEALVAEFAHVSPVHESISVPMATGLMTIHRQAFGGRLPRPKWKDD